MLFKCYCKREPRVALLFGWNNVKLREECQSGCSNFLSSSLWGRLTRHGTCERHVLYKRAGIKTTTVHHFIRIEKTPPELSLFDRSGKAWIASSLKGYMTRDLFLVWAILFINWMSQYWLTIDPHLRRQKALLILDAHLSRECPLAIYYLAIYNIDVLTLPAHTTHVLQLFDVGLASPMKKKFGDIFRSMLQEPNMFHTNAAFYRFCAISSVISAWESVCTLINCQNSARKTGIFPCSVDSVINSDFVTVLNSDQIAKYQKKMDRISKTLNISASLITKPDVLARISDHVRKNTAFSYLCSAPTAPYPEASRKFLYEEHNGCIFLGRSPPYISIDGKISFLE